MLTMCSHFRSLTTSLFRDKSARRVEEKEEQPGPISRGIRPPAPLVVHQASGWRINRQVIED